MLRLPQPWHINIGKRLVKRPKLYFTDLGIFHSLLAVGRREELLIHPKLGTSWEGFAPECLIRSIGTKNCPALVNAGKKAETPVRRHLHKG